MALPILLQRLFANSGVGPKLRPDIMPTSVLQTSEQTLTASEAEQVHKNLKVIQVLKELCLAAGATPEEIAALEAQETNES